jgi:hypothetical protein
MAMTTVTGTSIIRGAIWTRRFRLAALARDAGTSAHLLDAFMRGNADLPNDVKQRVVQDIWNGHAEYDADADMLRSKPQAPAKLLGVPPKLEMDLPRYEAGAAQRAHRPVDAVVEKPKERPGWLSIW